jgi:hypothetical protein
VYFLKKSKVPPSPEMKEPTKKRSIAEMISPEFQLGDNDTPTNTGVLTPEID